MKKLTAGTYKKDKLYPRVVKAITRLLQKTDEISPVAVLLEMGNLEPRQHEAWRGGQVPYLERVFQGSLPKANRILQLISFHAHDLNMAPSQHTYRQKGKNILLRFSKSGDPNLENAYARHFRWNQSVEKKQAMIDNILSDDQTVNKG